MRAISSAVITTAVVSAIALASFGVVHTAPQTGQARPGTIAIEPLMSPAGADSSAPQLTAEGDWAILSWMERSGKEAALKFSRRTTSGWSAPRTVATGTDLVVNAADVPSVRWIAEGLLAASWLKGAGPDPEAYDLYVAWSKDGGETWSKPTTPHHDGTKTMHGFASLFKAPGGGLGLVWLDGRATDPDTATGNMALHATAFGLDGKQLRDVAVDSRVCECCPTGVATTSEGPVVVYRNRSDKEVRDIYVSRLAAGRWTTPVAVHNDGWEIDACPVNGPAVSARDKAVAVAWFIAPQEQGRSFLAFSTDSGRTFGTPIRVDDGSTTGHVGVQLLADGSATVSYIEYANDRSQFRIRQIDPKGSRTTAVTVAGTGEGRVAGNPRIVQNKDELLLAWTETVSGASRVRTARAPVPGPKP